MEQCSNSVAGALSLKTEKPSHVGQAQWRLQREDGRSFAVEFVENAMDDTGGRKYGDVFMRLKE